MTKSEPIFIPMVRVHPDMITVYTSVMWTNGRPHRAKSDFQNMFVPGKSLNTNQSALSGKPVAAYSGSICEHSRKRLRKSINLLVAQSEWKTAVHFKSNSTFKFKVNFVTLTLPAPQGDVSDKYLKTKCLDPWIKTMRRRHKLKSYVWRAER